MFTIECLTYHKFYPNIQLCCDKDSLFLIVELLDANITIKQYKVSRGAGTIYTQDDLGWDSFNKWVSQFTYD